MIVVAMSVLLTTRGLDLMPKAVKLHSRWRAVIKANVGHSIKFDKWNLSDSNVDLFMCLIEGIRFGL